MVATFALPATIGAHLIFTVHVTVGRSAELEYNVSLSTRETFT